MTKLIDLSGKRFGKWTVVGLAYKKNGVTFWECTCDCGGKANVFRGSLRSGASASCGCVTAQKSKERAFKHGFSKTKIHMIWCTMKQRCTNKSSKSYQNYGGRGIGICDRWMEFENFYADMGASYVDGLSIERINNDLGYSPENCKWIAMSEQAKNRRPSSQWNRKNARSADDRCLSI